MLGSCISRIPIQKLWHTTHQRRLRSLHALVKEKVNEVNHNVQGAGVFFRAAVGLDYGDIVYILSGNLVLENHRKAKGNP